jgi:hypothetical protein
MLLHGHLNSSQSILLLPSVSYSFIMVTRYLQKQQATAEPQGANSQTEWLQGEAQCLAGTDEHGLVADLYCLPLNMYLVQCYPLRCAG